MQDLPLVALVGGFLGAGKTTLLLRAAAMLRTRGLRVALITNDQGDELVDTRLAAAAGFEAEEVAGGCFCCQFTDLVRAARRLVDYRPDVIFAEPVGSCMDISATVLQPMKAFYGDRFRLAPFTVLVDPAAAREHLGLRPDPHMAYLFRNQLAEGDLLCYTKADLHSDFPELGLPVDFRLSAESGEGVAAWLDELLAGARPAGARLLQVDYGRYADAEAALAWLNWRGELLLRKALSPPAVAGPLLDDLDRALTGAGVAIAHLKVFDETETGYIKASVCRNGEEPLVWGPLTASPARHHNIVLNLRARGAPEAIAPLVERITGALPGKLTVRHFECFRPGAPRPERRMSRVVGQ